MNDDLTQMDTEDASDMQAEAGDDAEAVAGKKKSEEDGIIAILIG